VASHATPVTILEIKGFGAQKPAKAGGNVL
jgi:hypothetical protein